MTNLANNFKATIVTRIGDLAKAETTAYQMLALLSRDLLVYVPESGDIGMVNRLLDALKTRNREIAVSFFREFLPWKVEGEKVKAFTTKSANKQVVEKHYAAIVTFLKDENNTIWTWADENLEDETPRKIDYYKQVTNTIARAIDPEKGHMSAKDVIAAVRDGGISIVDIITMADAMKSEAEEAEKAHAAEAEKEAARLKEMAAAAKATPAAKQAARKPRKDQKQAA